MSEVYTARLSSARSTNGINKIELSTSHFPFTKPSEQSTMSRLGDPSMRDVMLRLSRSSSLQYEHEDGSDNQRQNQERTESKATSESDFIGMSSPSSESANCSEHLGHLEIPANVARADEIRVVSVWDRRWCGLVFHSVAVGIVSTVLPLSVYPFLTCNLNMEGTQTLSARMLLGLPWALKPVFSLFIHCSPLPTRSRLRTAMQLGWAVTAAALIAIFFRDQPPPFFQDRTLVGRPLGELSTQQISTINSDAPSHGAFYVMLMCVASVGFVLADVAADELIRDVATQHLGVSASPHDEDGVLQPVMTKYRVVAMLSCFLFMGVGMSGWDYGGDFDFSLEYTQVMLLVGLVALAPAVLVRFTVSETARQRRSARQELSEMWSLARSCGLNHVLLCRFVGGVCAGVSATAVNPVAFYYAGVQPLNDTVVSFVAICVVLWALKWVDKKGWSVDYRSVIVVGTILTLALDLGATMFTIWDVVRSQWFWIGLPVMEAIPSALDYTISTVVLTEVVDPSAHASMSGLVTSVSFLAAPLGLAVSKYIDAQFDVTNQDIMADTTHVREHIMATFFIAYGMQLASLLWLFALPRTSSESREMKVRSGKSTIRGVALLVLLGATFLYVSAVHVLSVYGPTSCLGFSGGAWC